MRCWQPLCDRPILRDRHGRWVHADEHGRPGSRSRCTLGPAGAIIAHTAWPADDLWTGCR